MNKIIIGIIGLILILGIVWSIKSEDMMSSEKNHEVTEHDDKLASYEIAPATAISRVEANPNAVLLDVRTLEEYKEVHLANALLLPVQELSVETLAKIGLGEEAKDTEIILYCRSGARSKTAYDILKSLGYTNIKSVAGGMVHWQEDKYPLTETGAYTGRTIVANTEASQNESGPKIIVDRKLHDFGVIPQFGGKVETTFTVTNQGDESLEIGTLTTSCSCTAASVSDSLLAPGESATLKVVFDPNLHEEPFDVFKRTIFIPTNDPKNPELEISVQVDILEGE